MNGEEAKTNEQAIEEENVKTIVKELCKNCTYKAVLEDIIAITEGKKKTSTGSKRIFSIADVNGGSGPVMTKLRQMGLLDVAKETARKKLYILNTNIKVEWLKEVLTELKNKDNPFKWQRIEIPNDLFSIIYGYDDLKEFLLKTLQASKAASVLLVGPPASGKSLFLMELERIGGTLIVAGLGTKAGIRDIILIDRPAILLIDEIEKCSNPLDLSALLTWMESGRVIITKHKDYTNIVTTTKPLVVAACNTTKRLPPELLSRFAVFHLKEYTPSEFKFICEKLLVQRENIPRSLAVYITQALLAYGFRDVRDAVRIARLANTKEEAKRLIEIVVKYKDKT